MSVDFFDICDSVRNPKFPLQFRPRWPSVVFYMVLYNTTASESKKKCRNNSKVPKVLTIVYHYFPLIPYIFVSINCGQDGQILLIFCYSIRCCNTWQNQSRQKAYFLLQFMKILKELHNFIQ